VRLRVYKNMTTPTKHGSRGGLVLAMLGAALLLSCKAATGDPPGSGSGGTGGSDGTGGATSGGAGGDSAGSGGSSSGSDASDPNSDPNENPDGSSAAPEVLAAEMMVRMRLDAITGKIAGTQTLFIDCTMSPCSARMQAPTLTVMRELLLAISADFMGRIDFVVRLHLDGFTGSTYWADVVLDSDKKRPVPDDENELLSQ
jgi:hypothetical protein